MSSTNRKNASERHVSDYYITPQSEIENFINNFPEILEKIDFFDPCAGGDSTHEMSYPSVLNRFGKYVATNDIREDSLADSKINFLEYRGIDEFDVVITNPPFNIAQEIIEKSMNVVRQGGYVVMLLRLNFLGSKGRKAFWEKYPPSYIFVHHKRMSFTENGATDSIEYAHFVWIKGQTPEFAKLKVI